MSYFFVFVILLYFSVGLLYFIFTYILLYLYKLLFVCSAFELPVLIDLSRVETEHEITKFSAVHGHLLLNRCLQFLAAAEDFSGSNSYLEILSATFVPCIV